MLLQGKKALITGGSSGIGLTTAKLFKENGARVAITGTDPAKLERARAEIGGGRTLRQPGQGRKAAATTSFAPGRRSVSTLIPA